MLTVIITTQPLTLLFDPFEAVVLFLTGMEELDTLQQWSLLMFLHSDHRELRGR